MSPATPRRLCVQWPRFGTYHLARLQALHDRLSGSGTQVVGLEVASDDALYAWEEERGRTAYERVQVFPGTVYDTLTPAAIRSGVTAELERLQPDAVAINSYSAPDALACLAWCRVRRRTAVLMMESKADDAPRRAAGEWAKRQIVGAFDAALAGGTPQRKYLHELGFPPEAIFEPYDVVDNAAFAAAAEAVRRDPGPTSHLPGVGDGTPFFLASNRFVPRKNVAALIRAYKQYRASEGAGAWRLLLLGDGPERPALNALAASCEGVVFCGFRQRADLPAYYARAAAFVHPALQDQWGLVVNEAMASGLPVLVSDRAGCATDLVVEGMTGFTVSPVDETAFADGLRRLAALPAEARARMGAAARDRVAQWSPERFAEGMESAMLAGRARADRPMPTAARAVLATLRAVARRPRSFHTIVD